jgi:small-conductance mechanosensitive channel
MSPKNSKVPQAMPQAMFETRSQSWQDAGLGNQIARGEAKRARWHGLVLLAALGGVVALYAWRHAVFGVGGKACEGMHPHPFCTSDIPVRLAAAFALIVLSWPLALNAGRGLGPALFRRMEPATAGTVGFVLRFATVITVTLVALAIAGLSLGQLLGVAGATAVIAGLAAQQTLGNFFAGAVLISARPFRVGDRVRLQGGVLGGGKGQIEGVVSSQGLLYTTLAVGNELVMVPNNVVLNVAVRPLREPDAVSMRARLAPGMTPRHLQEVLESSLTTPMRRSPRITLEELQDGRAVVSIAATPQRSADGSALASELLAVVAQETSEAPDGVDADAGNGAGVPGD